MELFEQIDGWVAFERPDGPERVLAGDREELERYQAELARQRDRYDSAARLLFADVASTTRPDLRRQIVIRDRQSA